MDQPPPADLSCPICHGTVFRREHTRLSGKQLRGRFKATVMICARCAHMLFFQGWDDEERSAGFEILDAT